MPQDGVGDATQVEALIEEKTEGAEVQIRALAEEKVLVGAVNHRLQVADDG